MLLELNIKNFAIIDDMNISFNHGLNVLTGETGSGKSIIIEALGIILGGRGNKSLIQKGKDRAILQALFIIEDRSIKNKISKLGIRLEEDNLLLITREISINHPSISRVNGVTVTLSTLRDLSSYLIDIFAQKEHQSLLDINKHMEIVDNFGDQSLKKLKASIKDKYNVYVERKENLESMNLDPIKREREADLLKFQIDEIDSANLKLDEDLNLDREYAKISNINKIVEGLTQIRRNFDGDDFDSISILNLLNKNISILQEISDFDPLLEEYLEKISNINYELQDINLELDKYLNSIDFDEEKMFYISSRMDTINSLRKKYGSNIKDILEYRDKIEKDLKIIENYDKEIDRLQKEKDEIKKELLDLSLKLRQKRKTIGRLLEQKLLEELRELNMEGVDFKVGIEKLEEPNIFGIDRIEFMISTNIGEDLKPLVDIVSGGEMSRIMLAFKSILGKHDNIPTMVLDEIDTGISGRTAQVVGEKIAKISENSQIITITHLPQITAMADSHYVIEKKETDNRVISDIRKLDDEERVEELARILGGVDVTDTTLNHAREMLSLSRKIKD